NQITKITMGKESSVFKTLSPAVQAAPSDLCLTVVTPIVSLDLEARTTEMRDSWVKALHQVLVRSGKKSEKSGRSSNSSASPTPGSSPPSAVKGVAAASAAGAAAGADPDVSLLSQPSTMNLYTMTTRGEQV